MAGEISRIDGLLKVAIKNVSNYLSGMNLPRKPRFGGDAYGTARLNEVIELIYSVAKGFSKKKSGQIEENSDLSTLVARTRFELVSPP